MNSNTHQDISQDNSNSQLLQYRQVADKSSPVNKTIGTANNEYGSPVLTILNQNGQITV